VVLRPIGKNYRGDGLRSFTSNKKRYGITLVKHFKQILSEKTPFLPQLSLQYPPTNGFQLATRKIKASVKRLVSCSILVLFLGAQASLGVARLEALQVATNSTSAFEEIYIVRTVRDSTVAPTDFCASSRVGFGNVRAEDRYSLRSMMVRPSDGLIVDANVQTVGRMHACFGRTPDAAVASFYGEFVIAGKEFKATGECHTARSDYPEAGLATLRCSSALHDLPAGYLGGQLTTNSLTSRNASGVDTNPPGYVQSSIVTIRLWRTK
jgi:hypothetical protein